MARSALTCSVEVASISSSVCESGITSVSGLSGGAAFCSCIQGHRYPCALCFAAFLKKNPPPSCPAKAVSCKPLTVKAPPPRPPCPVVALHCPVLPDPAIVMQLLQAMEQAEELCRHERRVSISGAALSSTDPCHALMHPLLCSSLVLRQVCAIVMTRHWMIRVLQVPTY
jgi:hypothetical protein